MATAEEAYAILKGEMGTYGGQKYWRHVMDTDWESPGGTPHCACGVSWVLDMVGVKNPMPKASCAFDYSDNLGGRAHDKWDGQFMDIVSFDWPDKHGVLDGIGDHVGFFIGYLGGTKIETMEFNTGGGENARRVRDLANVICFLRPDWETSVGRWKRGESDGNRDKWWYELPDGTWYHDKWKKIDNKWYFFDSEGWLKGGWVNWKNEWYWCHNVHDGHFGEMAAGCCLEINGEWYAFADGNGDDGRMIHPSVNCDADSASSTFGALIL